MSVTKFSVRLSQVLLLVISYAVKADLIGVTQAYPDITLNNTYLIYDHNGIDTNTGILKVVAFGATLNEGPASGNSTLTQTYTGDNDSTPDLMINLAIDRFSGNWVNLVAPNINRVSIGFGNTVIPDGTANTPGFEWKGHITDFGWKEDILETPINEYGTFFDLSWKIYSDNYEDMPAALNQFVDGVLTQAMTHDFGGIILSNSKGFGALSHPAPFQKDWVFGTHADMTAVQNLLSPFLSGLSSQTCNTAVTSNCVSYIHSTVTADVFVPIPAAFWLWAGALCSIIPSLRRINKNSSMDN